MSKATGLNGLRLTVQAIMQMLRKKADADKVVSSVNGQTGDVTVEVPALPDNIVQSVNGAGPDAEGNVQVQVGVTSWNDLQGRPFYDTRSERSIDWDGTIAEKYHFFLQGDETSGMAFVKASDVTLSTSELTGATVEMSSGGTVMETITVKESNIDELEGAILVYQGSGSARTAVMMVALADGAPIWDMPELEKGVYFLCLFDGGAVAAYISRIVYGGGELKPIDEKFLPVASATEPGIAHLFGDGAAIDIYEKFLTYEDWLEFLKAAYSGLVGDYTDAFVPNVTFKAGSIYKMIGLPNENSYEEGGVWITEVHIPAINATTGVRGSLYLEFSGTESYNGNRVNVRKDLPNVLYVRSSPSDGSYGTSFEITVDENGAITAKQRNGLVF